jgi:valyl-tRNA synthetase
MSTTPTAEQPRPTTSLPPQYAPADVEGPLYQRWVDRGYFTADSGSDKPAYCIVIPPPNVTGSLHLGHAFQHTLMDALIRRRRMQGYEALWLPGMDPHGSRTQTLVERRPAETRAEQHDYTREEFVAKGVGVEGGVRRQDPRADAPLGDGLDWSRERFTWTRA